MANYVVGQLNGIKDADKMAEYRKVAVDALAKHGGRIFVPPTEPERIEGERDGPQKFILLEFPSAEAARAWKNDPDLASVHALRQAGADMTFFLLDTDK